MFSGTANRSAPSGHAPYPGRPDAGPPGYGMNPAATQVITIDAASLAALASQAAAAGIASCIADGCLG